MRVGVLRFVCVHSSANETGLSKKDVKRVRTEEIRHESLRVSVILTIAGVLFGTT